MNAFIGRERELAYLLDAQKNATNAVVEVVGIHGIGKSSLLHRLVEHTPTHEGLVAPPVRDLARFEFGSGTRASAPSEAAGLWEMIDESTELMLKFVEDIGTPEAFKTFPLQCAKATRNLGNPPADTELSAKHEVDLGTAARARDIFQSTNTTITMTGDALCQAIREAQAAIDDTFVAGWLEWSANRRVLIAVDGFETVINSELGDWFMRTALRLNNTLVVLARLPVARRRKATREGIERIDLAHFTLDEVDAYMEQRFRGEAGEGLAQVVHDFTAGHPGGVDLAGNLISEARVDQLTATELRRMLQRLPNDPDERWAGLVHLILEVVEDDSLREVVDACSLVSEFHEPLLAELLGEASTSERAGDAIGTLKGYGILKELPPAPNESRASYSLHEFIRVALARDLRSRYPGRAEDLDQRAAEHYFRELQAWEDGTSASYGAWYRYEDPAYQLCKRRWLRHAAQLSGVEITRARFLLVWLEAFWWWGYYHPFEFNQRLIDEWTQTVGPVVASGDGAGADVVADALQFILDNYPKGHSKQCDAWDEIRHSLLRLRDMCGLRKGVPRGVSEEEASDLAALWALINTFLGHTRRYREPADPSADRYLSTALATFEKLEDEWNVAWLLFECADLQIDRGDSASAIEFAARSAAVLERLATRDEEWDEELVANLARVRADADWLQGAHIDAFERYAVAVRHAYLFQGDHLPDGYTQRFYSEIATRSCERLLALHEEAPNEARSAAATLCQVAGGVPDDIADILARGDMPALGATLFLPPPQDSELRTPDSAFMDRWRVFEEDADTAGDVQSLLAAGKEPAA